MKLQNMDWFPDEGIDDLPKTIWLETGEEVLRMLFETDAIGVSEMSQEELRGWKAMNLKEAKKWKDEIAIDGKLPEGDVFRNMIAACKNPFLTP